MTRTIRYEIEMHPDAIDYHRAIPNSWLCTAYDERGVVVARLSGDDAAQALANAMRPLKVFCTTIAKPKPWWRFIAKVLRA